MQHRLYDHSALSAPIDRARRACRAAWAVARAGGCDACVARVGRRGQPWADDERAIARAGGGNMSRRLPIILYIMVVWFVISFVTNLIGPLMPILIGDFHLSLGLAGFLPFSFFLAYGLISILAGTLVEARGPRTTLLGAFALNLVGCLAISLYPTYAVVIGGLFVIGLGTAMLQVVIIPRQPGQSALVPGETIPGHRDA